MVESDAVHEDLGKIELLGEDPADFRVVETEQISLFLELGLGVDRAVREDSHIGFPGHGVNHRDGEILEKPGHEGLVGQGRLELWA